MIVLKVLFCRIFQAVFNIGQRLLPWRKPTLTEGRGSIQKIPELLETAGVKTPMVVTDPGLMKAGVAKKVLKVLEKAGVSYQLYDQVESNPSVITVNKVWAQYREFHCDGFIAIGGGSSMDAAKAAAARVVRPKKTVGQMGGLLRVLKRVPPFIAVPTTAGTGSETTIAALITDTDTHHKYALMDLSLMPRYAVLDSELTVGLPPFITAPTGMDALTHAIEAYLNWTYNTKETKKCAEDAVALVFQYLEAAYKDGTNLKAREKMLLASFKGGYAFTRACVGNVHAIAHTLGGLYNTPHGLANAVILPVVLEDYGKKVYKKLSRLSILAGVGKKEKSDAENAVNFIKEIRAMNQRMGIPTGFDFIREKDIPQMIKWAGKECNPIYPVPVIYNASRFRRIVEKIHIKTYRISETCTGCTACAKACPVSAIEGTRGKPHSINSKRCLCCGVCGRICYIEAVSDENDQPCKNIPRKEWTKPKIDQAVCSACGICITICKAKALSLSEPKVKGDINISAELSSPAKCLACNLCQIECPIGAITMEK